MSSYFTDETAIHQITFEDGMTIGIKDEMSIGDWEKYESSLINIEQNQNGNRSARRRNLGGNQSNQDVSINAGYLDLLVINILEWSLDRPLNKENIAKLKIRVSDVVLEAINERNPSNPLAVASQMLESSPVIKTGSKGQEDN